MGSTESFVENLLCCKVLEDGGAEASNKGESLHSQNNLIVGQEKLHNYKNRTLWKELHM